jgi:hypothetical protein
MKQLLAAALVTIAVGTFASAQEAPRISAAELQKILRFVDTVGSKQNLPPPTALQLGLSLDPAQILPVATVVTADHTVYFSRSELDPNDYIILAREAGNTSSYMFLTHPDFKLTRALYLRADDFPQSADANSSQVQAAYKTALIALAKDIDKTPLR